MTPPNSWEIVLRLTVVGEPLPKQRPHFGKGRAFTPKATRAAEKAIGYRACIARSHQKAEPGPLSLTARFYRKSGRTADLDNLVKLLTDALNGVVWKDDRQVVQLHASRFDRQENPRTEIEVYRFTGEG